MQYKVPQNVDIEDKVVGPLTLRQFLVILVTVGIIFVLYFVVPPLLRPLFFLLAFAVGALGLTIAFYKYGDQNLEVFIMSAWKTFSNPRQRIWKKAPEPVQTMAAAEAPKPAEKTSQKESLEEAEDDLARLAELVDSGGYVKVEQKDRMMGQFNKNDQLETGELNDPLASAEGDSPILRNTIKQAESGAPDREPLISDVASVSPAEQYQYPKIKTRGQK